MAWKWPEWPTNLNLKDWLLSGIIQVVYGKYIIRDVLFSNKWCLVLLNAKEYEVVPVVWLTDDKTSTLWPDTTDDLSYHVKNCVST